jgi:streptogramin lyase
LIIALFLSTASVLAATFTEYPIPTPGSGPWGITSGPDGALWFTEQRAGQIGRISTSGVVTEYHGTFNPRGIAAGPDGALWFIEGSTRSIGRITTAGTVTHFSIPNFVGDGIATGPDGALWFTEFSASRIGRITTGGAVNEYATPTLNSGPEEIASGPDGALWFTESYAKPDRSHCDRRFDYRVRNPGC